MIYIKQDAYREPLHIAETQSVISKSRFKFRAVVTWLILNLIGKQEDTVYRLHAYLMHVTLLSQPTPCDV